MVRNHIAAETAEAAGRPPGVRISWQAVSTLLVLLLAASQIHAALARRDRELLTAELRLVNQNIQALDARLVAMDKRIEALEKWRIERAERGSKE